MNLRTIHVGASAWHRLGLLLILCLCLYANHAAAQTYLQVYTSWNERYLDNPDQAVTEARKEFGQLTPEKNPDAWLQLLLFLTRNDWKGPWVGPNHDQLMKDARALAARNQYTDLALMLEYDQAETAVRQKQDYKQLRANYLNFIKKSEDKNATLAHAWLAAALAYSEYEQGDSTSALHFGKTAMDSILKIRSPDDSDTLYIKNTLAVILESLGNKTQTIEVYEDLEKLLRKRNFRYSLAIVLCNHGLLLVHNHLDMKKARALYEEALQIANHLPNDYLQTLAHKGLADVLLNEGQKEPALDHLNLALKTSETWSPYDLLRSGLYITKSKVLVEMKRWQEALETVAKGEHDITTKDKNTLRTIRYVMARSYAGLHQYQRAFHAQKEAFELMESIHKEEREKEINKLHVELGLKLQEQKSLALKTENQLQKERIEQDLWIRRTAVLVLVLALSIILLLSYSLRKAGQVKRSRERMQHVLDNIEEGIVTIGRGMKVETSFSPYLHKLLNLHPEHGDVFTHFLGVLDLNSDEKSRLRSTLEACLGEDKATWELNVGQLPAELSVESGGKWLGLHWQALVNEQGQVQSILLAVRDITETRRLQRERDRAEQNREDAERHLQELLLIDAREARSFAKEFHKTLDFLAQNLPSQMNLPECFRALHTCKGLARTLGLKELSRLVHELESGIDVKAQSIREPENLAQLFQKLQMEFTEYENWVHRLYPEGGMLRQQAPASLHEQIGRMMPTLRQQLNGAGLELEAFHIQDNVIQWDAQLLEQLGFMLMHGLTNSIDHGFIFPQRNGLQLARHPRLSIETSCDGDVYCIRLRDNGAGLNQEKLRSMAEARDFFPKAGEDWSDVLFLDGVSTATQVSQTSGRGVGLSAIQHMCRQLKGAARLSSNETGPGTCLELRIPQNAQDAVA